jgi:hypothetical protein
MVEGMLRDLLFAHVVSEKVGLAAASGSAPILIPMVR